MSDLTTLTAELATMKQKMVQRLTDQGVSGVTVATPMQDIVDDFATLRALNYDTTEITENGTYVAPDGKTGFNNFVVNVPTGGPATHKKYKLLDRVYEDVNGDAIGTVVGFHLDANNVEYAVVALDAVYRLASGQLTSATGAIADLPLYNNAGAYGARESATFNCDKILAQCATSGWASAALTHCREKTFTIAGESFAGQLPTIMELLKILEFREAVNSADTTAVDNPSLVIPNNQNMWSSTQYNPAAAWYVLTNGNTSNTTRTSSYFVAPVLEIPNA